VTTVHQFWEAYTTFVGMPSSVRPYETDKFGDTRDLANELGGLVVEGVKTATCSSLWEWEGEGKPPPEPGDRTIILDGDDVPLCIIETTSVEVRTFVEVDEALAFDEGEGDRSLESWREAHWQYFSRVLPPLGYRPAADMPVICERFKLVYAPEQPRSL
jgi:uncharacterized protein YhfF